MQTNSNGGSRDTEVKELAVKPLGVPFSCLVVTKVTPVAKEPKALRNFELLDFLNTSDLCSNILSLLFSPKEGADLKLG